MNESIYNLVPYEQQAHAKKPMHKSTRDHSDTRVAGSTFGK